MYWYSIHIQPFSEIGAILYFLYHAWDFSKYLSHVINYFLSTPVTVTWNFKSRTAFTSTFGILDTSRLNHIWIINNNILLVLILTTFIWDLFSITSWSAIGCLENRSGTLTNNYCDVRRTRDGVVPREVSEVGTLSLLRDYVTAHRKLLFARSKWLLHAGVGWSWSCSPSLFESCG